MRKKLNADRGSLAVDVQITNVEKDQQSYAYHAQNQGSKAF